MSTDQPAAESITLRPSIHGTDGLVSFTIYRSQSVSGESLNELLTLLAALSGGVLGVVQQHMPGARIEVGVHRESVVSRYVLGEVFGLAMANQSTVINPSSRVLAHVDTALGVDGPEIATSSPADQVPPDSAPGTHAQSALAKCCHAPAQSSRPVSSLPEKSQP